MPKRFDMFTSEARAILPHAQRVARELGHSEISPEHLLDGILDGDADGRPTDATVILDLLGFDRAAALGELKASMVPRTATVTGHVPMDGSTRHIVLHSTNVALVWHRKAVTTELILMQIALIDSPGSRLLALRGITSQRLSEAIAARPGTSVEHVPSRFHAARARWQLKMSPSR